MSNLILWYSVLLYIFNSVLWITARVIGVESSRNVCMTEICHQSAEQILNNMDRDIDPCDNFYKFVCGNYIRNTNVSDPRAIQRPHNLKNQLAMQLKTILEEESPPDELNAFKLAKKLYKACITNIATPNKKKNMKTLLDILKRFGSWPVLEGDKWIETDFNWMNTVKKLDSEDLYNFLIEWRVTRKRMENLIWIHRSTYHFRKEYGSYAANNHTVIQVAVALGADPNRAANELREAMKFELKLLKISPDLTTNLTTVASLIELFPNIPWLDYLRNILPQIDNNQKIQVTDYKYFFHLEQLMSETPKRVQANYLMFKTVLELMRLSNEAVQSKDCINSLSEGMFFSMGTLYARKYMKQGTKTEVSKLVEDIKKQFRIHLQNASWMDNDTKKNALDKLDSMSTWIGYPDQIFDDVNLDKYYESLVVDENDFLNSLLNLTRFTRSCIIQTFFRPTNTTTSFNTIGILEISAFYRLKSNTILIPAGYLQSYFFNSDRPNYMNYGLSGFTIGHEITHGFDNVRRRFDKNGNLVNWWAASTKKKFVEKIKCLIEQYNKYTIDEIGLNVNGTRTLNENIADNGGVRAAYHAYKNWVRRNEPEPTLPGLDYSPTQLFWISFGNNQCGKLGKHYLNQKVPLEPHAPLEFRVIGSLSNAAEFAEDFHCPAGSKMNPKTKCVVW